MDNKLYKQKIQNISNKILSRNNKVSSCLSWKTSTKQKFLDSNFTSLPKINLTDFNEAEFDFIEEIKKLNSILLEIKSTFDFKDEAGQILLKTTKSWKDVLILAKCRNTPEFYKQSVRIYGSSKDKLISTSELTLGEMARKLDKIIKKENPKLHSKIITPEMLKVELQKRFDLFFGVDDSPDVVLVNWLEADAAAGDGYIVLRDDAIFYEKDIDVLEVHEGWVHAGCGLNGFKQETATWLRDIPPRAEGLQEGLAAFMELLTMSTYPRRLGKIIDRVLAIELVENGSNFLEIFDWFLSRGMDKDAAYNSAARIFKGVSLEGGEAYTRDLSYLKGFLLVAEFIKQAILHNRSDCIHTLFNGFMDFYDVLPLTNLQKQGILSRPTFVPKIFHEIDSINLLEAVEEINLLNKIKYI